VAGPLEIRTYRDGDSAPLVDLLQASFGSWPGRRVAAHERPGELFSWKHERNPHGRSLIVVAEADGRVVAMRAYMPWPLEAGGQRLGAVQGVDLATHPDYRGRGATSELTTRARKILLEGETSLSLGLPNEMSRSQSLKAGWRPVGKLALWVRVRRPLRVLHRARSIKSVGRSLAVPSVEALPATDALADAGPVAELLRWRDAGQRLATASDVDYLRWRYEPVLGDYRAVLERDAGGLSGIAIFALRKRGELWEGSVCELLVRPGDHRTAGRLLRQVARAAPFDYLAAVPAGASGQARVLARAGFVPSPAGARSLGVTPYVERITPDPEQRESWSLSLGDLERLDLC
jgi:predicted N-acetyltransferase YhbS